MALSRLTVGVARDLNNNLLVPILTLSKNLSKKSARTGRERRNILLIQQNGERVRDMVHALIFLLADDTSLCTDSVSSEGAPNAAGQWHYPLSLRERDVLKGVMRGLSNKEIARELGLAEVTVKLHLRGVFRKMGARSRADAAVMATKAGFA